jgi:hypothetical protein
MHGDRATEKKQWVDDWRSLAERARVEMDPEKVLNLVSELNSVLEQQQRNCSAWKSHENRSKE